MVEPVEGEHGGREGRTEGNPSHTAGEKGWIGRSTFPRNGQLPGQVRRTVLSMLQTANDFHKSLNSRSPKGTNIIYHKNNSYNYTR